MTSYLRFFDYDKALNYYCELIEKMNQCTNRNNHERIIAKPILDRKSTRLNSSHRT